MEVAATASNFQVSPEIFFHNILKKSLKLRLIVMFPNEMEGNRRNLLNIFKNKRKNILVKSRQFTYFWIRQPRVGAG
jgi:hypothetical protein